MKRSAAVVLCLCTISTVQAHNDDPKLRDLEPPFVGPSYRRAVDGPMEGGPMRGPGLFDAKNIELMSWITLSDLAALTGQAQDNGNDCWGYTSSSGREYAIMGLWSGTAFVEVTEPGDAQFIGYIDGNNSLWRDIKVYQHYAYAVSEGGGGIQVIDMSNIDDVSNRVSLVNTVVTDGNIPTSATHNVAINEESGFLYRCGGGNNGLRIYSLANPAAPQFVGQWSDRYVHDCQVVNYTSGPFAGREIAFCCTGFNGGGVQTGLDILDVTDKQNIVNLYPQRVFWANPGYSHQVWLSSDRNYAYINDELDESNYSLNTLTIVVDVRFLQDAAFSAPSVASTFQAPSTAIGHNLYTRDNLIFEANYRSGLRMFCAENPTSPMEIAYFDTYPNNDGAGFNGAWSTYPYFSSGTVIVSDMQRGLFVLNVAPALSSLNVSYPTGRPTYVSSSGGTPVTARIGPPPCGTSSGEPVDVTLHYDAGAGIVDVPMNSLGANLYEAPIGPSTCWQEVSYYISALDGSGATITDPPYAPLNQHHVNSGYDDATILYNDMESGAGWTTSIVNATAGAWERGVPVNDAGWPYAPGADGDGSGRCWLTQNTTGESDVDGGSVRLISPPIDMTAPFSRLSYQYYVRLSTSFSVDGLFVDVSSNGAAGPWLRIRSHVEDGGQAWRSTTIFGEEIVLAGFTLTDNMRLRFTATDIGTDSIVEAGVDALRVSSLDCTAPCPGADGDLNTDGLIDGRDINAFTLAVLGTPGASELCHGDFTGDAILNDADVPGMVDALLGP